MLPFGKIYFNKKGVKNEKENSIISYRNCNGGSYICRLHNHTDKVEEGKTYMLHHADMQTASLPPQLPQVYSIELVEE